MEQKESIQTLIIRIFISFLLGFLLKLNKPDADTFSIVGLGLFINFCLRFFYRLGRTIPIRELIIIIALLQWVIAPIMSYHFFKKSEFYYMCIEEERYMYFVIPASIALIGGLLFPLGFKNESNSDEQPNENPDYFFKRGRILMIIGFLSTLLPPFMPVSLNYFFLLLSYTSLLGGFYILKTKNKYKYLLMAAAFAPIFTNAAHTAIFHELFLWGGFCLIMITYINKSQVLTKTILFSSLIVCVYVINSVKQGYREIIWSDDTESQIQNSPERMQSPTKSKGKGNTSQLLGMVGENVSNKSTPDDNSQSFVDRLNQGWIIARIMYVVPQYEPYANGETIMDGISAALLPRFFFPNKAVSGGFTNFERFTGLKLAGASMNLGIIGEAYANYGEQGGWLFLFIYGLFFNFVFQLVLRKSIINQEYLLWLPFLFFYVIKAEEDFTTIFNQFIKSLVVMALFFYLLNRLVKEEPFSP